MKLSEIEENLNETLEELEEKINQFDEEFVVKIIGDINGDFLWEASYISVVGLFLLITNLQPSTTSILGSVGLSGISLSNKRNDFTNTLEEFRNDKSALKWARRQLKKELRIAKPVKLISNNNDLENWLKDYKDNILNLEICTNCFFDAILKSRDDFVKGIKRKKKRWECKRKVDQCRFF